jgi:hypothetical protein
MTTVEIIVAIAIVLVIVAFLITPQFSDHPVRYPHYQALSNMRQLQMAMAQRALDCRTTGMPIAWTCDRTTPITYQQWKKTLAGEYLLAEDLEKLLTAPGGVKDAFTVFAVTEDDPANTLLFASKNWHGPQSSELSDEPFGKRSFVVFRKDGTGAVLQAKQVNQTDVIGAGGMHEYLPLK